MVFCELDNCYPFISVKIKEVTKELKILLDFDDECKPKLVVAKIAYDNNPTYHKGKTTIEPNENGLYVWKVKNPKLLHVYRVDWSY